MASLRGSDDCGVWSVLEHGYLSQPTPIAIGVKHRSSESERSRGVLVIGGMGASVGGIGRRGLFHLPNTCREETGQRLPEEE